MFWVGVFCAIGVAGLISIIAWTVWLAHKAADLFSEFAMLGDRASELAELAGQLAITDQSAEV